MSKKQYRMWLSKDRKTLWVRQNDITKLVPLDNGDNRPHCGGVKQFKTVLSAEKFKILYAHGCQDEMTTELLVFDDGVDLAIAQRRLNRLLQGKSFFFSRWVSGAVAAICIAGITAAAAIHAVNGAVPSAAALDAAVSAQPVRLQQNLPGRINPADIPSTATSWSFGNPEGQPLYVFSDPQCPYCKQLEQALLEVKDQYFIHIYPTPRLNQDSVAMIAQFACAEKPGEAWNRWMVAGEMAKDVQILDECGNAGIAAAQINLEFTQRNNLLAVPVIIRADGAVHLGSLDAAALKNWLQNKQLPVTASSTCGE